MLNEDYKKQYLNLKHRLNIIRTKLIYSLLDESSTIFLKSIDSLAKELDIRFSDEKYLDEIEGKVINFEKGFNLIRV